MFPSIWVGTQIKEKIASLIIIVKYVRTDMMHLKIKTQNACLQGCRVCQSQLQYYCSGNCQQFRAWLQLLISFCQRT